MKDVRNEPAVRDHRLLTLVALAVMGLTLFADGFGGWSVLPVVPGLLSVLFFSSAGPVFTLGLLTFVLGLGNRLRDQAAPSGHGPELTDLLLAAACLVYVSAHWRLLGLVREALPADARRGRRAPRRRLEGRWMLPREDSARTPERSSPRELFVVIAQAVLFAAVGFVLGVRLLLETHPEGMGVNDRAWRVLLVVWALLLSLMGGYSVFAALRWVLTGADEGVLYLQDQLWSATRGEQRRIDALAVKARLRQERKGGQ